MLGTEERVNPVLVGILADMVEQALGCDGGIVKEGEEGLQLAETTWWRHE